MIWNYSFNDIKHNGIPFFFFNNNKKKEILKIALLFAVNAL